MRLKFQIFFAVIFVVIIIGCKESTQIDLDKSVKVQYGKEIVLKSFENVSSVESIKINTSIEKSLSDKREAYEIKIDGKEISITSGGEAGFIKFEWSSEGQKKEVVPEKYLFHSVAQKNETKLLSLLLEEIK